MKWIGQHIYDLVAKFRNTVDFSEDVTFYQPVNNADPKISIGASDDERLAIQVQYQGTTTQTAQVVSFATFTESATANDGRFHFSVDGTRILKIQDAGINLSANMGLAINDVDIITDSSGTATLSNIDDLDATTIATFNAHLTAGDITGVVLTADDSNTVSDTGGSADFTIQGNNGITTAIDTHMTISGVNASTSAKGVVELATTAETTTGTDTGRAVTPDGLKDGYQGSANVTTLGTIGTGTWNGTAIASAYLDADTAHLSGTQTFSGAKTFSATTTTFTSATADSPLVKILNTTDDDQAGRLMFEKLRDDDGVATGQNLGEIWFTGQDNAQNTEDYAYIVGEIDVSTGGQESGKLSFGVAAHDGSNRTAMTLTGGSESTEVDATIGLGASSVTTISGTLTMGSTASLTNAGLVAVANQSNITGLGTISSGVWQGTAIASAYIADDAVTFAKASGVTPNVYGSIIKILPSDFATNDDGGATKHGIGFVDHDNSTYGIKAPNSATELLAFISIPEGMKATHVDIHDNSHNLAIEVFEADINSGGMTSKGSGNANTQLDITDVNATATNFLIIQVTTVATSNRVFGGQVTIAAQ